MGFSQRLIVEDFVLLPPDEGTRPLFAQEDKYMVQKRTESPIFSEKMSPVVSTKGAAPLFVPVLPASTLLAAPFLNFNNMCFASSAMEVVDFMHLVTPVFRTVAHSLLLCMRLSSTPMCGADTSPPNFVTRLRRF